MKRLTTLLSLVFLSVMAFSQALTNAEIMTYSFTEQTAPATIDTTANTVDVEVEYGTDLTNLVATFTLSDSATAYVDTVMQESGVTANDFTSPVTYTIVAEDTSVTQDYTVTVSVAENDEAEIYAFSFPQQLSPATIDTAANTVNIDVLDGTDLTNLVATFTLSDSATAYVDTVIQESGVTANDFTSPVTYTIVAEDTSVTQNYTVTVTSVVNDEAEILDFSFPEQAGPASIDSASHTIEIEVDYGTDRTDLVASYTISSGATATVGGTIQQSGVTINDFSSPVIYTITAQDGTTEQDWVVLVSEANPSTETDILSFNVPMQEDTTTINDTAHIVSLMVDYQLDLTSVAANFTISAGATAYIDTLELISDSTNADYSDPVTITVVAEDTTVSQDWTVKIIKDDNTETEILSYSFPEQTGPATFDTVNNLIEVEVEYGTDITDLVATFTLSDSATAKVENFPQESGVSSRDFTDTVKYIVYAENDTITEDWFVNVTMQPGADILAFSFVEQTEVAEIDRNAKTVDINVETDVSKSSLVAIFSLSEGATATVGGVEQNSGYTVNDFTSPVTYTLVNSDSTITNDWLVNVSGGVGIEVLSDENISLYPNPATDAVNLKINNQANENLKVSVINAEGRVVKLADFGNAGDINERINLNDLSTGIYNLRISLGDKEIIKKLIIK